MEPPFHVLVQWISKSSSSSIFAAQERLLCSAIGRTKRTTTGKNRGRGRARGRLRFWERRTRKEERSNRQSFIRLCSTPFWFSLSARLREPATDTLRIEVCSVDRRIGLLPPRLIQTACINTVKSKLIDEPQDDGFSFIIIA